MSSVSDEVDLDPGVRQEILDLDARLGLLDHYRVLGLEPGADSEQVKKAYWVQSRRFHPDRFYGRKLGPFASKIDRIFRRIAEAQQVLVDPVRRDEYLKEHPELRQRRTETASSSPRTSNPVDTREDERKARFAKHPYLLKATRVTELINKARAALATGEFAKAHSDLHLASQMEPKNPEITKLLMAARKGQSESRGVSALRKAEAAETLGDWDNALKSYQEAFSSDPTLGRAAARAAELMKRLHKDLNQARMLAQKAVELNPKSADYKVLWATLLHEMGMKKLAVRQVEEALKLNPEHEEAKRQARLMR
jgi:curved DNA-binding protein CbpA